MRLHAAVPAEAIIPVGADAAAPAPGVLEAIAEADFVLFPPSNPVVSIGPILAVPGIRAAVAAKTVVGVSGIIGGAPVRGMADACLTAIGVETTAAAVAAHYGAELHRRLAGRRRRTRRRPTTRRWPGSRSAPCRCTCATSRRPPRSPRPPSTSRRNSPMTKARARMHRPWHRSRTGPVQISASRHAGGLVRRRPGRPDRRRGALAADGPGLLDGDILVVTSKVVSKAEGRVAAMRRDDAIAAETVRVVARRGATTIAQTRHGFVMAAAGVDESNTAPGTVVLLPEDPDDSARRLRKALRGPARGDVGRGGHRHHGPAVAGGADRHRDRRGRGAAGARPPGRGRTRSATPSRSRWRRWRTRSPPRATWSRARPTAAGGDRPRAVRPGHRRRRPGRAGARPGRERGHVPARGGGRAARPAHGPRRSPTSRSTRPPSRARSTPR